MRSLKESINEPFMAMQVSVLCVDIDSVIGFQGITFLTKMNFLLLKLCEYICIHPILLYQVPTSSSMMFY